jgi:hypothetical protein
MQEIEDIGAEIERTWQAAQYRTEEFPSDRATCT